jgi:hypothetical protein
MYKLILKIKFIILIIKPVKEWNNTGYNFKIKEWWKNFKNLIFKWKKNLRKNKIKLFWKLFHRIKKFFIQKIKVEVEGWKALDQLCADQGLPIWKSTDPSNKCLMISSFHLISYLVMSSLKTRYFINLSKSRFLCANNSSGVSLACWQIQWLPC